MSCLLYFKNSPFFNLNQNENSKTKQTRKINTPQTQKKQPQNKIPNTNQNRAAFQVERRLQTQPGAAKVWKKPWSWPPPYLLAKVHDYHEEPSAPQKGVEHILLSSAPQQGSNLAPKCLCDLWEVLILILHSSFPFQAFAPVFSTVEIASAPPIPCGMCRDTMCFPSFLCWDIWTLPGTTGSITGTVWHLLKKHGFRLNRAAQQPWQTYVLISGSFWQHTGLKRPVWNQKARFRLKGGLGFQAQPLQSTCSALNSSREKTPVCIACAKKTLLFCGLYMEQSGSNFSDSTPNPSPPLFSLFLSFCNDIGTSLEDV